MQSALISALNARAPRRIPRMRGLVRAAVAVVLVPTAEGLGTVLIGRPVRSSDRWSGDIAFPGGLASAEEHDIETARRETMEEVGLALGAPVARLADRLTIAPGRNRPMRVRAHVFVHASEPLLTPDPREVAMVRIATLASIEHAVRQPLARKIGPLRPSFPSIPMGDHVLWGLSLGLLDEIFRALRSRGTGSEVDGTASLEV
jgi:8-oxo-dGTP pyrophosphatase MutT (NUDIX family)